MTRSYYPQINEVRKSDHMAVTKSGWIEYACAGQLWKIGTRLKTIAYYKGEKRISSGYLHFSIETLLFSTGSYALGRSAKFGGSLC